MLKLDKNTDENTDKKTYLFYKCSAVILSLLLCLFIILLTIPIEKKLAPVDLGSFPSGGISSFKVSPEKTKSWPSINIRMAQLRPYLTTRNQDKYFVKKGDYYEATFDNVSQIISLPFLQRNHLESIRITRVPLLQVSKNLRYDTPIFKSTTRINGVVSTTNIKIDKNSLTKLTPLERSGYQVLLAGDILKYELSNDTINSAIYTHEELEEISAELFLVHLESINLNNQTIYKHRDNKEDIINSFKENRIF